MTVQSPELTAADLRDLGPHLIDCREHFGVAPRVAWGIQRLEDLKAMARHVQQKGRGPGSLEDDSTAGLDYHVVDRPTIEEQLPALYEAYVSFAPKVSEVLGREVVPSADRGAINVNIVEGVDSRYELHTDSQPWTLILGAGGHFLGGDLVVEHPLYGSLRVPPVLGQGVLVDGSRLPHAVLPLEPYGRGTPPTRITVPMVYVDAERGDHRPEGTDDYLYGG